MIFSSENESCLVFYNSGIIVFYLKVYVFYGSRLKLVEKFWCMKLVVLFNFDLVENKWEWKVLICCFYFGFIFFLVNGRFYVVGGKVKIYEIYYYLYGDLVLVEVYDE